MHSPLSPDLAQRWQAALGTLTELLGEQTVDGWLRGCELVSLDEDRARLLAPTTLHRERILSAFENELRQALGVRALEIDAMELDLEATFAEDDLFQEVPPLPQVSPEPKVASATSAPAQELEPEHNSAPAFVDKPILNATYDFDNFVVGPCNRFAHAAAHGVADRPGEAFNPLFLHGSVGLGKTHLMHAIAHRIMRQQPNMRVAVLSCEEFINHFVGSLREGSIQHFRQRYRKVDVMIVDDVQLLANKQRTQEEFFHTFNALRAENKQIVLSSDAHPSEIPDLQDRLVSRFKWGLVAEIEPPCFETRVAILRRKGDDLGIELSTDIASFIAEHVESNVRELEGTLTRLHALSRLHGLPLSLPLARQALGRDRQQQSLRIIRMDDILRVVIDHFGTRLADLQSKRRTQSIVYPRQVAMFLARSLTDLSLEEIGGHFGGRDHSTVVYAIDKLDRRRRVDGEFAALLSDLERRIRQGNQ
jgi:chromosomal replication initiator protein